MSKISGVTSAIKDAVGDVGKISKNVSKQASIASNAGKSAKQKIAQTAGHFAENAGPIGHQAGQAVRNSSLEASRLAQTGGKAAWDYSKRAARGVQDAGIAKTAFRGAVGGAVIGGASSLVTGDDFWDSAGTGAIRGVGLNTVATGVRAAGLPTRKHLEQGYSYAKGQMTKSAKALTDTMKSSRFAQQANNLQGINKI